MSDQEPETYVPVHEARDILRVSRSKMARLVAQGYFEIKDFPLDKRLKLLRRRDVEALAATAQDLWGVPDAST